MRYQAFAAFLILFFADPAFSQQIANPVMHRHDWPIYGGDAGNTHYSPLQQINRENVRNLQVAWTYDAEEKKGNTIPALGQGGLETTPIEVGGVLYGITPSLKIFALDAATGQELWKWGDAIEGGQPNRGLSYWADGKDMRILVGIADWVYALDARTGSLIVEFGENGRIDLRKNLGRDSLTQDLISTSPGMVYKDLIIFGDREPEVLPAPPGDIRAYEIKTGRLRWSFHTIPHPGEFGYKTWPKHAWTYSGGANNWMGMALDEEHGVLYAPTGSAATDFYGANRLGDNLFANCLIALDAETGKRLWHFQSVKHDLWDRDFPAPPVLLTVKQDGRRIHAVAQTTKSGFVYLFDRANGKPLFPIKYRHYPPSDVPGEKAAATQPLPTKPAPFARQILTEDMLTNRTPEAHQAAIEQFRQLRSDGQFLPFTVDRETVVFPGFDGGAEWGGSAVDVGTGVLYVNSNDVVFSGAVARNPGLGIARSGSLYRNQCAVCHRDDRAGSPPEFPSLIDVGNRLRRDEIEMRIRDGKGRMPAFNAMEDYQIDALVDYLVKGKDAHLESTLPTPAYHFTGYKRFLDPDGYPAVVPPWGTLNAIDMNSGEYLWKIPFGEYPELAAKGMKNTGTENYGGPIVTAGGIVFIGATNYDKKFHAYDKATGELLWETTLPFAGNATPITYEVNGRQYVAIAAGGGKALNLPSGGIYVAFALPQNAAAAK